MEKEFEKEITVRVKWVEDGLEFTGSAWEVGALLKSLVVKERKERKKETHVQEKKSEKKPAAKETKKKTKKKRKRREIKARRGRKKWTKNELDFLRENYSTMSSKEIGKQLGRTAKAVLMRAQIIGISGKKGKKRRSMSKKKKQIDENKWSRWTEREEAYLKSNWHNGTNIPFLAKALNRTEQAIRSRAWTIGLKSQETILMEEAKKQRERESSEGVERFDDV